MAPDALPRHVDTLWLARSIAGALGVDVVDFDTGVCPRMGMLESRG